MGDSEETISRQNARREELELRELEIDVRLKQRQVAGRPTWWDVVKFTLTIVVLITGIGQFVHQMEEDRRSEFRNRIQELMAQLDSQPRATLEVLPIYLENIEAAANDEQDELRNAVAARLIPQVYGAPPNGADFRNEEWVEISTLSSGYLWSLLEENPLPQDAQEKLDRRLQRENSRGLTEVREAFRRFPNVPDNHADFPVWKRHIQDLCSANRGLHRLMGDVPEEWCREMVVTREGVLRQFHGLCSADCTAQAEGGSS